MKIKSSHFILVVCFTSLLICFKSNAQCPTVSETTQVFCDLESLFISDLQATDGGAGVAWFDSLTSTTPLDNSESLVDGAIYYADNSTGNCGSRQGVTVSILGPPEGLSFQGVCVETASEATLFNLNVNGNDVQWYLTETGGAALPNSTILIDETIYYADQASATTGCRTSRLSVFVNVGIVDTPQGESIQEFCVSNNNIPTVADLIASGTNNWYSSLSSGLPLDLSTPLVNGQTYFATKLDPPCESENRLAVEVILYQQDNPGTDATLELCETDTAIVDLFDSLGGTPDTGGTWSPELASGTGLFDPTIDPPGEYTYSVSATNPLCEDAQAVVTVTLATLPNAGTDGNLDLCQGTTDTVDLFDSLGGTPDTGGTWSPELASGTGLFDPTVDPPGEYTYTVASTNNTCPDATANVVVNFIPNPNAGTDANLELCETDTAIVDLFDSLGGTPDTGGTWSPELASGTGLFDPTIDPPGEYTYSVSATNPLCEDAQAVVTVTLATLPNAGTDGNLDLCQGTTDTVDLFDSLGGTPDTGGTWSPELASGTGLFDPTVDPPGEYTYTVASTNNTCPDATANVVVNFIPNPNAGTDANLELCETDTAIVDLFDSLGGTPDTGGTWSPELASGTGLFDPTIDPPGEYTYSVSATNPLCEDAQAVVTVTFATLPNAGTDGNLDLCQGTTDTVDLFDSLGGTPDTGGTWSPELASGTGLFDPTIDPPGEYTYTVASTNNTCPDATANVVVNFIPNPNAGTDANLELCETDTAIVDLFDSLGGTPDTGGTWSPELASGTGLFDPTIDPPGEYTYSVSATNPLCEDAQAVVTVTFATLPNAGTDGNLDLCQGTTDTVDLFDSLGGTPDTGGTWSPELASGTGLFDPTVDPPGEYTYTVASTNNTCPDATANVVVNFIPNPNAGTDANLELCETDTAIVDLFDSLGGTPDTGGTWSPELASGTGLFDPTIDPPGEYTYSVSATNPLCEDAQAVVTVTLATLPNAGTDGNLDLCQGTTDTVDLFDSLGGTPDTGGTWSPELASGTGLFDPTIDPPGEYTYTVASTNNTCPDATANVVVNFIPNPNAGTDANLELCETDTAIVDLFDSLGGTPDTGGTWSPELASGTGLFDPTIDPPGEYTYSVSATNPLCEDAQAVVTVTFATLPNAGTDGNLDLCQGTTDTVDLFDSLGGTPDTGGTWSPELASGTGLFDPTIDPPGEYTYTVASTNNTCPDATANVVVNFIPNPNAGTDANLELCETDTAIVDLFDSLGGTPDTGGTWSPELASGTGLFDPTIDPPGEYTYSVSATNPLCEDAQAVVTVTLATLPNAGTDGNLDLCQGTTDTVDLFDSLGGTPDTGGTWSPELASGTGLFDPTVDPPGEYTYTVNQIQCGLSDSSVINVSFIENPDVSGLKIDIENTCLGEDVTVSFLNMILIPDGEYTIVYEITGPNIFSATTNLTVVDGISNFLILGTNFLNSGSHEFNLISFFDSNTECQANLSAVPTIPFEILETITPELIEDGNFFCPSDNATIQDLTNNIVTSGTIEWFDSLLGGTALDNDNLLTDGTTYYASVTTENGCPSTNRLEVLVAIGPCDDTLVIPDGFSPNNDGINDTFVIRNLEILYPNFKLTIYNRHGNLIYEGEINTPKWNGTTTKNRIGGGTLPVGVYFYILEFNDGITKDIQGRVYLSR